MCVASTSLKPPAASDVAEMKDAKVPLSVLARVYLDTEKLLGQLGKLRDALSIKR